MHPSSFLVPCWAHGNGAVPPTDPLTSDPLCYKLTQALDKISSDKEDAVCTLNAVCNGLVCNFTAFSMKLWVLPCAHPPVVRLALIDNQGEKLFDDVVLETTRIQAQNHSIEVEYDRQEGEFGVEVSTKSLAYSKAIIMQLTSLPGLREPGDEARFSYLSRLLFLCFSQ